jgi:hypothetical protein
MFSAILDDEDRQRVNAERRAEEALRWLCERAPLRVVQWVGDLLEHVCARLRQRVEGEERAA